MTQPVKRLRRMGPAAFLVAMVAGCTMSGPAPVTTETISEAVVETQPVIISGDRIHTIQGAGLRSPLEGKTVSNISGIVTAFRADGFYMQDPDPDEDEGTSEGIFVFTGVVPRVRPGDEVRVSGLVEEFYPGGLESNNQPITHIVDPEVNIILSGNVLPAPVLIGEGGRVPPTEVIDDDGGKQFEQQQDGLDFYESLESMLLQIDSAVVVAATNAYKETAILPTGISHAGPFTARGGLLLRIDDQNPERILLDDGLRPVPDAVMGDQLAASVVGILDYSFGNYKFQPIMKVSFIRGELTKETARPAQEGELIIASYNVENLDALDNPNRFSGLANQIVNHLKSPDILVLEEVQDNNGILNDGTVDANETYRLLIDAIVETGGPEYQFRDVPPLDNRDGGELGGNIRVGFLFRTDRGLQFIDRGRNPSAAPEPVANAGEIVLSQSPGQIQPNAGAFYESRKPLVGEFSFYGQKIFIIGVHLNSKSGDTALYGLYQPPRLDSERQRIQQANIIQRYVAQLQGLDPDALVVVAGDMNDFQFSETLAALKGSNLTDVVELLPVAEQYTYVYEGNSQALDHILVSTSLAKQVSEVDIVHLNAEFLENQRTSDHDPVLAYFRLQK
ncbi:MAG: endonuclease/exonuclease/phosphatase [Chloroflexi bacterium]|nr:MAG: endonuclease/exonuclease/phosphatase [Chloroflexota bacterium]